MIRTVIVDDDRGMRLVARMLAEEEGCLVVGEAETGEQAIRLVARLAPDLVIMDYRLPGMDGIEATRRVLRASPGAVIIAWSCDGDPELAHAFLTAGASAHAVKGELEKLRTTLRGLASGQPV